ncbi:Zinc-binding alcohol dehydrogenase domain-containing protein cipB [Lachnellula suecica]|uniref:Zinc-binding alcohol dehydrogenase domain-containing protein cipB n=1 Tax=Lachnellula suecica TaxID=602035 RepID=A0A8T9C524_9HELO|nr:Zinc-binding alcohol dehydrogenase domain-containing protein cipB [Lachnellula suecica]
MDTPHQVPLSCSCFKGKISVGAFDAFGVGAWVYSVDFVEKTESVRLVVISDNHERVTLKQVFAASIKGNHIGKAISEDFLAAALESEILVPAPEPFVAGEGLDSGQGTVNFTKRRNLGPEGCILALT